MIILALLLLGLCFGSFVNALVYRLHEQTQSEKHKAKKTDDLSIMHGRSMCVHCKHVLSWSDLVPVISWIILKGKCRYCRKPISWQYPLVELATAVIFVLSYFAWPVARLGNGNAESSVLFGFWLVFLVGFVALTVYDLRWQLLPNRIVFPLLGIGLMQVMARVLLGGDTGVFLQSLAGLIVGGGLFYILFQVSNGRWIGGGDVKLGFLLGLLLGGPIDAMIMIFLASLLGTLITSPLLLSGKASRSSHIPFGPFLIFSTVLVYLYGSHITSWYQKILVPSG